VDRHSRFSEQLAGADTPEKLRETYLRLLRVQDYFDLPTASDDPDEQAEQNTAYGRSFGPLRWARAYGELKQRGWADDDAL